MEYFEHNDNHIIELHQAISTQVEKFKEEINAKNYSSVNYLLYNMNTKCDDLLYHMKRETDNFFSNHTKEEEQCFRGKKFEALIKIQTITSTITCHLLKEIKSKCSSN